MSQTRRVSLATGASLLLHALFFAVLAIAFGGEMTDATRDATKAPQPDALDALDAAEPEEPLEVVFFAPPKEPPAPLPQQLAVLRTQLDPAILQKTEQAPEGTERLASHHSEGEEGATPTSKAEAGESSEGMALARTAATDPQSAVKAIGAWKQAVGNAVGVRWNYYRENYRDQLPVGAVCLRFRVDAKGAVSGIRVIQEKTDPGAAAAVPFVIKAVEEAQIPPMPLERLALTKGGLVEVEYTATIFPSTPLP